MMEEVTVSAHLDEDIQNPEPYGFVCGVLCFSGIFCWCCCWLILRGGVMMEEIQIYMSDANNYEQVEPMGFLCGVLCASGIFCA